MASPRDDLRSEIAKGNVLAIVGAGVSSGATGRNPLASWTGLLANGVERCVERRKLPPGWEERRRGEIASGDLDELLSAAENVATKLGAPSGGEYRSWLRETVGSLHVLDGAVLAALRDLGVTLATTNYDGLLEEGTDLHRVTWREGALMERVIRGDDRGVLHLHGYWEEPESVILGLRSYEQILRDARAQNLQQALRTIRTLLFVGCGAGLDDPNFRALRQWSKVFKDSEYGHFRLCLDCERDALFEEHPREERILPLSYGVRHEDLAEFLQDLKPPIRAKSPAILASGNGSPRLPGLRNCFGRDEQIRDLVESICADPPLPVPVLGQAGIGKSTVVIAALYDPRVADRYGKRRFFVSCDSATDRENLVGEIARSLGVEPGDEQEDRLFLQLEQGPSVLALDNAETPYWAEGANFEDLLSRLGSVAGLALVVSLRGDQRPLGPRWRKAIRLLPLDKSSARDAFLAVAGENFRKDDPYLDRLLEDVDGMPLAVTLLAHQAEIEPDLASLWERWKEKRTELLRRANGKNRLNDIEVSLDLSLGSPLMTEKARRLLSLLAILPGGIRRDNLRAFFPEVPEAAQILRRVGLALDDATGLRALAPVREYVREKHGVTREDLQRAVKYYLQWAKEIQQALEANTLEFSQHVAQELGNLEALVIASLTLPVADPDSNEDTSEKIKSVLSLGSLLSYTGLGLRAPRIVGKALERAEDIADERLQIDSRILLGEIASVRDNLEEARAHFSASIELSRKIGDEALEAVGISKLGIVEQAYSNLAEARRCYEKANDLFAKLGLAEEQGRCLVSLARIDFDRGDLVLAAAKTQEAMSLLVRAKNELGRANCLHLLGEIALESAEPALAKERILAAQAIYEERTSPVGRANCLKNLGRAELQLGHEDAAAAHLTEALGLCRLLGFRHGEADCLQSLGDLKLRSDLAAARSRYEEALTIYERIGDPFLVGRAHARLGRMATAAEERSRHLEAARTAWSRIHRPDLVRQLEESLARCESVESYLR